jgi:hypothetical protein
MDRERKQRRGGLGPRCIYKGKPGLTGGGRREGAGRGILASRRVGRWVGEPEGDGMPRLDAGAWGRRFFPGPPAREATGTVAGSPRS